MSLTALLIVLTIQASAQVITPGSDGTTAIEQALIEHACRAKLPGVAGEDAYRECLGTRLESLRADVGRDLTRVSAADRKALDAACSERPRRSSKPTENSPNSGQIPHPRRLFHLQPRQAEANLASISLLALKNITPASIVRV